MKSCNNCDENDWTKFLEQDEEDRDGRTVRKFECNNCGAEGRIFDKGETAIVSGAMR